MGPWWLTWHLCLYICEKCEMSRLWRTDGRTHGKWKVEQYSVWAESAISSANWPFPDNYLFITGAPVQSDVGLVGSQSWVCWSIPELDGQVVGQEDDLSSGKEQHWVPGPLTRTTGCCRSLLADPINDCHHSHHQHLIVLSPGQQIMTGDRRRRPDGEWHCWQHQVVPDVVLGHGALAPL